MTIIKDIFNISYEPKLDENSTEEKISEIVSTIIAKTLYNFTTVEGGTSKDDFDNFYTIPTSQHANMVHFLIKIYQKCTIMIKARLNLESPSVRAALVSTRVVHKPIKAQ